MRKSPTKEITRWHHRKMLCSFPIIGIWRSHRVSRPPCDSDYCYLNCFRQWHEMVDKRKMFLRNQFWRFLFHQDILQLCSWLSLRFLMPWINHVPPVCRSTFCKSSLDWWWVCKIIKWYIMKGSHWSVSMLGLIGSTAASKLSSYSWNGLRISSRYLDLACSYSYCCLWVDWTHVAWQRPRYGW